MHGNTIFITAVNAPDMTAFDKNIVCVTNRHAVKEASWPAVWTCTHS